MNNSPDNNVTNAAVADKVKKRPSARKITGWVFTALGLAIVLFLLFAVITVAVDKFANKSPVPSFFGASALIVTTGSMSGTIEQGDLVIVQKSDEYKFGEIITYMPSDGTVPVTHRIVGVDGDKFVTQGDANNVEDPRKVDKSDVVGKVVGVVPHVGLFFNWVANEMGWLYIVGVIVVIVAGIVLLKQFPRGTKEN